MFAIATSVAAHDRVPEPFVASTCPFDPAVAGNVKVTLAETSAGALSAMYWLESSSNILTLLPDEMLRCAVLLTTPVPLGCKAISALSTTVRKLLSTATIDPSMFLPEMPAVNFLAIICSLNCCCFYAVYHNNSICSRATGI